MKFGTDFRMLLLIVAYASCVVHVFCMNDSKKSEIRDSMVVNVTTNSTDSNNTYGLDRKRSEIGVNESPTRNLTTVFMEGETAVEGNSKEIVISATTRKSVQSKSFQEKNLQPENDQSSMGDSDHKAHKGRKGVVEELVTEHTALDMSKTAKSDNSSLQYVNDITHITTSTAASLYNSTVNESSVSSLDSNKSNTHEPTTQLGGASMNLTVNNNSTTTRSENPLESTGDKLSVTEIPSSPRQKPFVTRVDSDTDDNSSYSLTSTETDYVIPVVATIFAAPLLIVLGMFLYKRSKEFWERRHYRRMDFLIDGMYND